MFYLKGYVFKFLISKAVLGLNGKKSDQKYICFGMGRAGEQRAKRTFGRSSHTVAADSNMFVDFFFRCKKL